MGKTGQRSTPLAAVTRAVLVAAAISIALAGCASAAAAPAEPSSAPTVAPAAAPDGSPDDGAIAASCAAVALTETTMHNARTDLANGTITVEQHTALLDSVVVAYRSLQAGPATQRGLKDEISAVVGYLKSVEPTESIAPFDPDSNDFRAVTEPIRLACEANGSEIYVFATTGG